MKKLVNLLSFISAMITSILIICTIMTSYQFFYVDQIFNSYRPVQIGSAVTMALISLRFWVSKDDNNRIAYSVISLLISVILIFSTSLVK